MTVKELAQEYAELLVAFHKINLRVESDRAHYGSALREDLLKKHCAYDALVNAQNRLNTAAEREAQMEVA